MQPTVGVGDTVRIIPIRVRSDMPRRPRLEMLGVPLHVTHRGVNRAATFLDDEDFLLYRRCLGEVLAEHDIALHAYVLMTNHVHLLLTPSATGRLSAAMCQLGRRYVPAFNRKYGRTGTLWEGRFKSCLVDSARYLLMVHRYIELNPVRAGMVGAAEGYRWSSARSSLGLVEDPLVTVHPTYSGLGADAAQRARAYCEWLGQGMDETDLTVIRSHARQERALGDPWFQMMVERTLNRPARLRVPGRPAKRGQSQFPPDSRARRTDSNGN